MPRDKDQPGRIGNCWLSLRPNSPIWCRTWFDRTTRQTRRASLGTTDLEEAKLKLAGWVVSHERMEDVRPSDVALETILIRYYQQYAKNISSAEQQRIALRLWSDFFPASTVAELTIDRQEAFVRALRVRGLSDGYISRILSVGRAALNRAYKRQEIVSVPFVISAGQGPARDRRLSIEEVAALFEAADTEHLFIYLMIAFNTLARPEAIFDLTRRQIDIENRLIDLNPPGRKQTKKRRPVVPITETLLPWLEKVDDGPVVNYSGRRISSNKTAFHTARDKAGLGADVTPYTIRHTMATELRKRSVPPWEVAGIMGHKEPRHGTTEVYSRYAPDYLGKAAAAIDAYFRDLQVITDRPLTPASLSLRASSVPVIRIGNPQVLGIMVGAAGIEPATPTMST